MMGRRKIHREHGDYRRYMQGCRCQLCRDGLSFYMREWRDRVGRIGVGLVAPAPWQGEWWKGQDA